MTELKDWTVEVWRIDGRRRDGGYLVKKYDWVCQTVDDMQGHMARLNESYHGRYRFELRETYRTVRNAMTGEQVLERYDTPWSCSVASETYWCS